MIERRLKHYRILEQIGAGGMGQVYRARDERLERDVALKILPAGAFAAEDARRRFRREALALSKLDHPNIATVHDFDTEDTPQGPVDFLVMGLVPGRGLDERLGSGPLSETEVLRLGVQLLQGLAAAQEQGVVHRDLKPGNLRIGPEGRLRILDFGLAALRREEADTAASTGSLSHAGAGTPPYMAPEQVEGRVTDARTDIWAAGAVLYEMATGRRPFPQVGVLLVEAILHEPPTPPAALNSRVSTGLEFVILKALEKAPARRYQSAREMLLDLERLLAPSTTLRMPRRAATGHRRRLAAAGAVAMVFIVLMALGLTRLRGRLAGGGNSPIDSVAVLPLDNLSGDAEQDYLADGITEALIADLAKIHALKVISRTSVMRYKGTSKALPEIARELKADAVVEGSVARSGNRVRVTAQLVHAASDRHLWAETYDRDLDDMLAVQAELARAIVAEIRIQVTSQERARLATARTVPHEAYDAYLRGRHYWNKRTEEDLKRAISYFQRAIDADPGYALAYSGLADAYFYRGYGFGALPPREAMPRAKAAALKALELDDTLGEAHTSLAMIRYFFDWDFPGAEAEIERALALSPNYATAHHFKAVYLWTFYRRADEAIAEAKRALELDPLSVPIHNVAALILSRTSRSQEAAELARRLLELDPSYASGHDHLGRAYERDGRPAEALAEYLKAESLGGAENAAIAELTKAYESGRLEGFRRKRSELAIEAARSKPPTHLWELFDLAEDCGRLGQKDEAFRLLERAYAERSGALLWINAYEGFAGLRSDPRYNELLRRIGMPPPAR